MPGHPRTAPSRCLQTHSVLVHDSYASALSPLSKTVPARRALRAARLYGGDGRRALGGLRRPFLVCAQMDATLPESTT